MRSPIIVFTMLVVSFSSFGQDKNADAKVHYITAEEQFNSGTLLGAKNCIYELEQAERALGQTNSKILYLKLMAGDKFFSSGYYEHDMVDWLKKFFKITDTKSFPEDKYADILKLNSGIRSILVEETSIYWEDPASSVIIENPKYSLEYRSTDIAHYELGRMLYDDALKAYKGNKEDMWMDKGLFEALSYYKLAADKGNIRAMRELSYMYSEGLGTIKDDKEALQWALKGSDTTKIIFLYVLNETELITNGREVIDWCKSIILIKPTRREDSVAFQYGPIVIAEIYEGGIGGVTKDYVQAMEWYIKAYDNGNSEASSSISELNYKTSEVKNKEERKAVNELYNNWRKSYNKKMKGN